MSKLEEKLQQKAALVKSETGKNVELSPAREMEVILKQMQPEIERAVTGILTPERFARIALSAWTSNPNFWKCSKVSFLSSLMKSAQCGLEPNTVLGEAYLISYGNEITFQLGYHGVLALCHRSKMYQTIYAHPVYKNDKFEYSYGLDKKLEHVPADVPEGEPTHYYAVYKLTGGGSDFVVWSRDRIIKHAKQYSKTFSSASSPWQKQFDSMALKTVLLNVLKFAPKSVELAKATAYDETPGNAGKLDTENDSYTDVEFMDADLATEVVPDIIGEYEQVIIK